MNNRLMESKGQLKVNGRREQDVIDSLQESEEGKKIDPARIWWL